MSRPSDEELHSLAQVAGELRDVFSARGHRVSVACDVDPAFGSGFTRAWLARDLAVDAVSAAASHVGLDFRPVNGNGRELRTLSGIVDRRYRLRKGVRDEAGQLLITASADSTLTDPDELPPEQLLDQEQWVFAFTLTPDGLIDEVVVAEVVDYADGSPGYLELGQVISLDDHDFPSGGFRPRDEGLDGFGDDDSDEEPESGAS